MRSPLVNSHSRFCGTAMIHLAYLAEQMIEMHKQKQVHVRHFWQDLKATTAPDTFKNLREHGKQERSL
jgi:hypothetical protein